MNFNMKKKEKAELILFGVQVSVIFIVICTSLINLTLDNGNKNLWTVILTSSLGYILPNPRIKIESEDKKPIKVQSFATLEDK